MQEDRCSVKLYGDKCIWSKEQISIQYINTLPNKMELHLCKCITPKTPSNWYVKHMHHKTANAYGKALFMYDQVFQKVFFFPIYFTL